MIMGIRKRKEGVRSRCSSPPVSGCAGHSRCLFSGDAHVIGYSQILANIAIAAVCVCDQRYLLIPVISNGPLVDVTSLWDMTGDDLIVMQ